MSQSYETFIGLEVHIHLLTASKVFCGCRNEFGSEPNTNVCPVCMGYPGVLPSLNEEAVRQSYQVSMALNCQLNEKAVFERKNYFYPDMPKNYQISQFQYPFGINGFFDLQLTGGDVKRIRIHDVHLEEDAGKMIHRGSHSLLDYNRAGSALLEIVTEPDLSTGEEAEAFIQQFRQMVRYLGVTDGNMEEGSLRCDANVSINDFGKGLGTKTEVKNLNSSKFVKKALEYEIKRQSKVIRTGDKIIQETRLWDEEKSQTSSMRTKESSNDYRYFPEPDLPPFRPSPEFLASIKESLVEMPEVRKIRITRAYDLNSQQALFLTAEKDMVDFFETVVKMDTDAELEAKSGSRSNVFASSAASWLGGNVQKILNDSGLGIAGSPLTPGRFYRILKMIEQDKISSSVGKQVLGIVFEKNSEPEEIVKDLGLTQMSDEGELKSIVSKIVDANPNVADAIRGGADKQIGFLMGQVMKVTSGKANPAVTGKLIRDKVFKMELD